MLFDFFFLFTGFSDFSDPYRNPPPKEALSNKLTEESCQNWLESARFCSQNNTKKVSQRKSYFKCHTIKMKKVELKTCAFMSAVSGSCINVKATVNYLSMLHVRSFLSRYSTFLSHSKPCIMVLNYSYVWVWEWKASHTFPNVIFVSGSL